MLFGLRVVLLYSQEGIQDHHRDLKFIHVKIFYLVDTEHQKFPVTGSDTDPL